MTKEVDHQQLFEKVAQGAMCVWVYGTKGIRWRKHAAPLGKPSGPAQIKNGTTHTFQSKGRVLYINRDKLLDFKGTQFQYWTTDALLTEEQRSIITVCLRRWSANHRSSTKVGSTV